MSLTTTKTYFWVSKNTSDEIKSGKTDSQIFTFHFPPEFIASRNRKWIIVEECKATFRDNPDKAPCHSQRFDRRTSRGNSCTRSSPLPC